MPIQVEFVKCPQCTCAVDGHFFSLTSLLGPAAVECHWCGTVVPTGRIEWWEMGWPAQLWFLGVSLFYIALAGFLGGESSRTALGAWETGEWQGGWGIGEPGFWAGAVAWGGLVILIQLYRVARSLARRGAPQQTPLRHSLWSIQVGGQLKVFLVLILIPFLCWFAGWAAGHRP
jgi:hypothetical protein